MPRLFVRVTRKLTKGVSTIFHMYLTRTSVLALYKPDQGQGITIGIEKLKPKLDLKGKKSATNLLYL